MEYKDLMSSAYEIYNFLDKEEFASNDSRIDAVEKAYFMAHKLCDRIMEFHRETKREDD